MLLVRRTTRHTAVCHTAGCRSVCCRPMYNHIASRVIHGKSSVCFAWNKYGNKGQHIFPCSPIALHAAVCIPQRDCVKVHNVPPYWCGIAPHNGLSRRCMLHCRITTIPPASRRHRLSVSASVRHEWPRLPIVRWASWPIHAGPFSDHPRI